MPTRRKPLYIFGWPSFVGGADTKLVHLLPLLKDRFEVTVIPNYPDQLGERTWTDYLKKLKMKSCLIDDLPRKLKGTALSLCNGAFFNDRIAHRAKEKGLRIVWSSEMMWHHGGEEEAAKAGVIDKVLYVSDLQKKYLAKGYGTLPSAMTGNFVNPRSFPFKERQNETFAIGRLSRADPAKYPEDFPVFYERLELPDVCYRVMAWSKELADKYRWHKFGPEWELLKEAQETQIDFLHSIDLFVYPLGHNFRESWGRSTVEAMLTGCIPLVPPGHHLDHLVKDGVNGFICSDFKEYQERAHQLYNDFDFRRQMSRRAREHTAKTHCDAKQHSKIWGEALS
jgi:hypothetical protein